MKIGYTWSSFYKVIILLLCVLILQCDGKGEKGGRGGGSRRGGRSGGADNSSGKCS